MGLGRHRKVCGMWGNMTWVTLRTNYTSWPLSSHFIVTNTHGKILQLEKIKLASFTPSETLNVFICQLKPSKSEAQGF